MSSCKILLQTNVSRKVAASVLAFVADLKTKGYAVSVSNPALEQEVADYTGVRSAVGGNHYDGLGLNSRFHGVSDCNAGSTFSHKACR